MHQCISAVAGAQNSSQMAKRFFLLSIFVVLSWDVPHLEGSPAETRESRNETSKISPPTNNTTAKTPAATSDENPVTVVANFTTAGNPKTSGEPMRILAEINTTKPGEGKAPTISLVPPSFPGAPFGLVAHVPQQKPVEIDADAPPGTPIRVQAEVSPDVPLVAFVIGHGEARFYSPWKKASSATRNLFDVNLR